MLHIMNKLINKAREYGVISTLALVAGLSAVFLLSACSPGIINGMDMIKGSGVMLTQEREIPEFHSVVSSCPGILYISQGKEHSLRITTDDNLMQFFESEVIDGVLHLRLKPNSYVSPTKLEMRLVVGGINSISLKGSGRVLGQGTLHSENLAVSIKGSGDASLKVEASTVCIDIKGSGDANMELSAQMIAVHSKGSGRVRLAGQVSTQSISLKGSGDYLASDLKSQGARVLVMGTGDARLKVSRELDVKVVGSGSVYYAGNPQVTRNIKGSGRLIRLQ